MYSYLAYNTNIHLFCDTYSVHWYIRHACLSLSMWICFTLLSLWLTLHIVRWCRWRLWIYEKKCFKFFLSLHSILICVFAQIYDDYISGLDWIGLGRDLTLILLILCTGYDGLVSQSNAHTHTEWRRGCSQIDRLYINSHEFTHSNTQFSLDPFSFLLFLVQTNDFIFHPISQFVYFLVPFLRCVIIWWHDTVDTFCDHLFDCDDFSLSFHCSELNSSRWFSVLFFASNNLLRCKIFCILEVWAQMLFSHRTKENQSMNLTTRIIDVMLCTEMSWNAVWYIAFEWKHWIFESLLGTLENVLFVLCAYVRDTSTQYSCTFFQFFKWATLKTNKMFILSHWC